VSAEILVNTGQLTVVFPDDFEMPAKGLVSMVLGSEDVPEEYRSQQLGLFTGPTSNPFGYVPWVGRTNDLGFLAVGRYQIGAWVYREGEQAYDWEETGDRYQGSVEVKAGQRATCRLE
jgi:hypothetical protein